MPSLLTRDEREKFLAETPVWKMNRTQYQAAKGVHQPWIAEISPFQHAGLSNRARREYDARRSQEWAASGACKSEYDRLVFEAYKRGEFTLKDEGVTSDAESAVAYLSVQEKKDDRERRINEARRENQILHVDDAEEGDRVFIVGYGTYATVVKKLKVSFRLKAENTGREWKIAAGACTWLSYGDMVKAVDEGRPINPHGNPDADPEPPTPPAAAAQPQPQSEQQTAIAAAGGTAALRLASSTTDAPKAGVTQARAEEMITELMREHGLLARGWTYRFDRQRTRFGVCNYPDKFLGFSLLLIECNDEARLRDTILHEIAHALTEGAGHGPLWKVTARALGANPEAACGEGVNEPDNKYHATCHGCGHVHKLSRLPKKPKVCGVCYEKHTHAFMPRARKAEISARYVLVWVNQKTGDFATSKEEQAGKGAQEEAPKAAAGAAKAEEREPETWTVKPMTGATQASLF